MYGWIQVLLHLRGFAKLTTGLPVPLRFGGQTASWCQIHLLDKIQIQIQQIHLLDNTWNEKIQQLDNTWNEIKIKRYSCWIILQQIIVSNLCWNSYSFTSIIVKPCLRIKLFWSMITIAKQMQLCPLLLFLLFVEEFVLDFQLSCIPMICFAFSPRFVICFKENSLHFSTLNLQRDLGQVAVISQVLASSALA